MWNGANGRSDGLIVTNLYEEGVINSQQFSFYLTRKGTDSYIDFGAPNTAVMENPDQIVWLDVI